MRLFRASSRFDAAILTSATDAAHRTPLEWSGGQGRRGAPWSQENIEFGATSRPAMANRRQRTGFGTIRSLESWSSTRDSRKGLAVTREEADARSYPDGRPGSHFDRAARALRGA